MLPLSGILPVAPTPFTDDGGIDRDAMRRVVEFVIASRADGIVFPGFASEVSELTQAERVDLLSVTTQSVAAGFPIVAGASATTADDVIANGRAAEGLGVRTVMIQPPLAIGNQTAAVMGFMQTIAAALPDTRIILQNAPAPRGSDLSPQTIVAVASAIPAIAYVKEETLPAGPAVSAILANRPDTLLGVIGGGGARYILDEYDRGACAAMPAAEIADLHVDLDRAWRTNRRAEAREIYVRTLPLLTLQAVYRMRLTKYVLMQRGILENTFVRAPTPELDDAAIADIDTNLAELGLLTSDDRTLVSAE
jgi:4-hydroxy-tetrahydrodipicolinate synthase